MYTTVGDPLTNMVSSRSCQGCNKRDHNGYDDYDYNDDRVDNGCGSGDDDDDEEDDGNIIDNNEKYNVVISINTQ